MKVQVEQCEKIRQSLLNKFALEDKTTELLNLKLLAPVHDVIITCKCEGIPPYMQEMKRKKQLSGTEGALL